MKIVQGSANINNNIEFSGDKQQIAQLELGLISSLSETADLGGKFSDDEEEISSTSLTLQVQAAEQKFNDSDGSSSSSKVIKGDDGDGKIIRNASTKMDLTRLNKAETHWGCFGVGEKVFAFWKGKTAFSTGYYSGTIIKKGVLNVYNIHFDDDTVSNTSEVQILPIRVLGVGVKVFYLADEEGTGPVSALVVGQKFEGDKDEVAGDDVEYAIEIYGKPETILCERRQLYLGANQAKELRKKYEAVQPKLGDLNLDNIVTGPRRRGQVSESVDSKSLSSDNEDFLEKPKTPKKKSSPSSRSSHSNRKLKSARSFQSAGLPPKATAVSNSNNNSRKRVRPKSATPEAEDDNKPDSTTEPPPAKSKPTALSHQTKLLTDSSSRPAVNHKVLQSPLKKSPIKSQEPKVQKDNASVQKHIISSQEMATTKKITQRPESNQILVKAKPKSVKVVSNKVDGLPDVVQSSTTSGAAVQKSGIFKGYYFYLTSGDRDSMKGQGVENYSKEISKNEMLTMLKKQQGIELLRVGDEQGKDAKKVFLLASSHLRTLKYLYCVARGIPCVAQKWIADSVAAKEVLDWEKYRLSPGWSLEENRLANMHSNFPLEGLRVGLCTYKEDTINTWQKLVPAAKGKILISKDFYYDKQPPELKLPEEWLNGAIDILVSDFFCPLDKAEMLKSKGIPLVRIEWLVQTIIMGKRADPKVGDGQQQACPPQNQNQGQQQPPSSS